MTVRELVEMLRRLPDQEVQVIVSDGVSGNIWFGATGIVEQAVSSSCSNPDFFEPGMERAIEIV